MSKKLFSSLFISGLIALVSLTGCDQKTNADDLTPQTVTGEKGDKGDTGEPGHDGTSVLTGEGIPGNSLGSEGDSYINLLTWDYYVKEGNVWVLKGNIKGNDGTNGSQGQPGNNGVSVTSISLTSSEDNVDTYTITYSNGTSSIFKVTNGVDGEDGESIQGEPGADGHSPLVTIGSNGNWYIDGNDSGISAKGPQGEIGPQGPAGQNGRGIDHIEIIDNNFVVFYTDNTSEVVGSIIPTSDTEPFVFMLREDGTYSVKATEAAKDYAVLTIPATYNGIDVTGIAAEGFKELHSLESVTIPSNVTSIGVYAFYDCIGLTSVTLPDTLTSIGKSAFRHCSSLKSIRIPSAVRFIGSYSFYETALDYATFENTSSSWRHKLENSNNATAAGSESSGSGIAAAIKGNGYLKTDGMTFSSYNSCKYDLISTSSVAAKALRFSSISFTVYYRNYGESTTEYTHVVTITATFYTNDWYW